MKEYSVGSTNTERTEVEDATFEEMSRFALDSTYPNRFIALSTRVEREMRSEPRTPGDISKKTKVLDQNDSLATI